MNQDFTLRYLLNKLKRDKGVDFTEYKEDSIMRRVVNRMRATDTGSYKEYMRILNWDRQEYDKLINELTVNYTEWFRDEEVWQELDENIIPQIFADKTKRATERVPLKIMRIWSAGCATGEEVYSLAILLRESCLADNRFRISIFATDIDKASLDKAREGKYRQDDLRELTLRLRDRYFIKDSETYKIKPELARLIRFKEHNLVQDEPIKYLDLILCRNVMIYLDKKLQNNLYCLFYNSLKKNGFLVTGRAEKPMGETAKMFRVIDNKNHIYQKI